MPTKNVCKGTSHYRAKLDNKAVLKIRELSEQGVSKAEIGRLFKVSDVNICKIVTYKTWRHVI
jgi:hypothetical protein